MRLLERIREGAGRAVARLSLVGADPRDDEDLRARKSLLVLISVLILPVAALWGALYLSFGAWVGVRPSPGSPYSRCGGGITPPAGRPARGRSRPDGRR